MSPFIPGAVHTAHLLGIAGPWAVVGTVTIWGVETTPAGTTVLTMQISDQPSPRRISGHTAYARGEVSIPTSGRRQLVSIITPKPGPTSISIGWTQLAQRAPGDAPHHLEQADKELADWLPIPDDGSPLGVSALPHLARAAARADEHQDDDHQRDALVRRLRAGGVPRADVALALGRDPSRVTQLCRSGATARTKVAS
ncbi:hypothetical protein [Streptomyces rubellomurinus]|uniref:Uncharacterized protein n=1 Tax=Streptomyces rubellomurinus (strain ATCC 31215) TaxID=359131 RepID=A0A0F2TED3_STRR3|nr:hypothetical protein [Streptomyces rubellomurinus]KJS60665.1 hypothetical protein VM95_19810 [Streptomyces rubellomurinus]